MDDFVLPTVKSANAMLHKVSRFNGFCNERFFNEQFSFTSRAASELA